MTFDEVQSLCISITLLAKQKGSVALVAVARDGTEDGSQSVYWSTCAGLVLDVCGLGVLVERHVRLQLEPSGRSYVDPDALELCNEAVEGGASSVVVAFVRSHECNRARSWPQNVASIACVGRTLQVLGLSNRIAGYCEELWKGRETNGAARVEVRGSRWSATLGRGGTLEGTTTTPGTNGTNGRAEGRAAGGGGGRGLTHSGDLEGFSAVGSGGGSASVSCPHCSSPDGHCPHHGGGST